MPAGADGYYGIQCKGKDEYTNAALDEKGIDAEIEKAKQFTPALKKLYFATTANKDATIEAYTRSRNLENMAAGSFGIALYCWEDIVDLIDENKATHDWYVESQNFRTQHSAALTFENGEMSMDYSVPFLKKVKRYFVKDEWYKKMEEETAARMALFMLPETVKAAWRIESLFSKAEWKPKVNRSYCNFRLRLSNAGSAPIKQFRVFLSFEGTFDKVSVHKDNFKVVVRPYNVSIDENARKGTLIPHRSTLVQDDAILFDKISIRPLKEDAPIVIRWKLVSEDYKAEGVLALNIHIDFKTRTERIEVTDKSDERIEELPIEDYITDGKDEAD